MSGRGHHFIPKQFILGFVNETDRVWMYRKGLATPVAVKRRDVAKQRDFNSEEVDQVITEYEQRLVGLLNKLRATKKGDSVDPLIASEVVSHLNHRTQSTRGTMSQMAAGMFAAIREIVGSEGAMTRALELDKPVANDRASELLREGFEKLPFWPLVPKLQPTFLRLGYFSLREMFPALYRDVSAPVTDALVDLSGKADSIIADLHDKSSAQAPDETGWYRTLSKLPWRVEHTTGEPLVLPDCVALGSDHTGNWEPLLTIGNSARAIIMPLSPTSVLIGGELEEVPDPSALNAYAAAASHLFFLAQSQHASLDDLHGQIGTATAAKVDGLMGDLRAEYAASGSEKAVELTSGGEYPEGEPLGAAQPVPKFWEISFIDFADEEIGRQVADHLGPLLRTIGQDWNLAWLDGITFAADYKAAVETLDRGFEASRIVITEKEGQQSTSIPLLVKRDGELKYRLIVQGWVALALIGDDAKEADLALSILCSQVLWIALTESREQAFPRAGTRVEPTTVREFFMRPVESLAISYCAHKMSAMVAPDLAGEWAQFSVDAIERLHEELPEARWQYRLDGDLDKLIDTALSLAGACLHQLANYFAYLHELGEQVASEKVERALASVGLTNWAKLFASDLKALADALPDWRTLDHLYLFGQHVERLLLNYGLLIEEQADAGIYVHVPEAFDLERMIEWTQQNESSS